MSGLIGAVAVIAAAFITGFLGRRQGTRGISKTAREAHSTANQALEEAREEARKCRAEMAQLKQEVDRQRRRNRQLVNALAARFDFIRTEDMDSDDPGDD